MPHHLIDEHGRLGARNGVSCSSIEHKLGLRAAPTGRRTPHVVDHARFHRSRTRSGAVAGAADAGGGKAPVLIFEDVDIDEAAAGAVFAGFGAAGQTCVSGTRFLVAQSIHEAFTRAFAERVNTLRVGDPADASTDMGPVISAASRARSHPAALRRLVRRRRATVESGAAV